MFSNARSLLQKTPKEWKVFKDSFFNNNYFCHIELVILALLGDEDKRKRQKALKFIQKFRNQKKPDDPIRKFEKYTENQVNLSAHDYSNFIKYDQVDITEPPATFKLGLDVLQDIVDGKNCLFALSDREKMNKLKLYS